MSEHGEIEQELRNIFEETLPQKRELIARKLLEMLPEQVDKQVELWRKSFEEALPQMIREAEAMQKTTAL